MKPLCGLVLCVCLGCGSTSGGDSSPADSGGTEASAPLDGATKTCATLMTKSGPVEGASGSEVCSYEGIPFAAPPTGTLRWKAPAAPASWTAPRPSKAASGCPQVASQFGDASSEEDCLYLNVWTGGEPSAKAPVMVFVHGGSFLYGSGTFATYDGTKLAAATGNVVVTLNYRLGAFGFLSNVALRAEDPNGSAGNYGLQDQIAAFQWVNANIAAFGGDPTNVTIFGESAGGTSMFAHLASPKSKGLFEHMIVESAAAPNYQGALSQAAADQNGSVLASALACSGSGLVACLRSKSAAAVLSAYNMGAGAGLMWFPSVDGVVLPDFPLKTIASGAFNKVPTLLGNNANEGTLFELESPPTDAASYLAVAEAAFPGHGATVVAEYPPSAYSGSLQAAASDAVTDGVFLCPTRYVARSITRTGTPTYRYDFVHVVAIPIPNLGAFHGSELLFVFGNGIDGLVSLQANELPLSQDIMGYWGAMASAGNPNRSGLFSWPAYEMSTEPEIVLDLTLKTETEQKKAKCDFWDSFSL